MAQKAQQSAEMQALRRELRAKEEQLQQIGAENRLREEQLREEMRVREEQEQADRQAFRVQQEETRRLQAQMEEMMRMMHLRTTHETQAAPAPTAASNYNIDRNPHNWQVRSNKNLTPWDERAANAPDANSKFPVFVIQMKRYFRDEECEDALSAPHPIKVHNTDSTRLIREFGHEAVAKAKRAMAIILDKVTDPTLLRQIDLFASPSESWQHLLKTYTTPQQTQKALL